MGLLTLRTNVVVPHKIAHFPCNVHPNYTRDFLILGKLLIIYKELHIRRTIMHALVRYEGRLQRLALSRLHIRSAATQSLEKQGQANFFLWSKAPGT
jgi:hypothetical protein